MSVLTGRRALMGLDVMRAWRATDVIIPTATSLGIPAVFWLQLLTDSRSGRPRRKALAARSRWVTGRNGFDRLDPTRPKQRRIQNGGIPEANGVYGAKT